MEIEDRITNLENMMKEVVSKLDSVLQNSKTQKTISDKKDAKEESPREFLLKFNPKTDTEKTLVAIHYLEEKNCPTITIKEIENIFKEMREKVPANISDKIQLLDKRAFLKLTGQEGKRKNWVVSNKGEEFLGRLKENARRK